MSVFRKLSLAAVLLLASVRVATAASVPGMGFEAGFASWAGTGSVVTGSEAHSGNSYGKLTGTQSLKQAVHLVVGQTYGFMWRFIAGDYLPYNDNATLSVGKNTITLASVATVGNYGDSGWQYYSWVPSANFNGQIKFGVNNAIDNKFNSTLLLDAAVPLPGAALLFGSALLGAGVLRRRKMAARQAEMIAA